MKMKTEFTIADVTKALGPPREKIRAWIKLDFIKPTSPAAGQGMATLFSLQDVHSIALFLSLIDHGFHRATASDFVQQLRDCEREQNQEVEFIYLRESINRKTGKARKGIMALESGRKYKVDLDTGLTPYMRAVAMSADEDSPMVDRDWINIHIVNFGTLKKEVNEALAKT